MLTSKATFDLHVTVSVDADRWSASCSRCGHPLAERLPAADIAQMIVQAVGHVCHVAAT